MHGGANSRRPLLKKEGNLAMEEIWKDIEGYHGKYQVSNLGNVRRVGKRVLKPQKRGNGYLFVWLYDGNNNAKHISVHRLVAQAFIPNPFGLDEVNHLDECKINNRADNLEWCTHQENCVYRDRNKRIGLANTNGKKSKAIAQYTLDGTLVCVYPSLQEAGRHGYAASNICRCANGHQKYSHAYGYMWRYADRVRDETQYSFEKEN